MSYNNQNSSHEDAGDKKLSRTTVVTLVALALALVIITTAVVIANRNKAPEQIPEIPDASDTQPPAQTDGTSDTQKPTEKPTDAPSNSTPTQGKLPSLVLPATGTLMSKHNPELQVFSPTMNDYRVHLGIDLETKENAPVYAVADGKVSKIWVDTKMGYCLAISHAGDAVSIYKNLAEALPEGIKEGVSVRSGQLIATVGDSAMVEVGEEPHLHFEMTVNNLSVDPLKYFDEKTIDSITPTNTEE